MLYPEKCYKIASTPAVRVRIVYNEAATVAKTAKVRSTFRVKGYTGKLASGIIKFATYMQGYIIMK